MKKTKLRKHSLMPIPKLKRKVDKAQQDFYRRKKLKCLVCRKPADIVHHFVPQSQSAFLRYNEINLIPLCQSCHFRHHCTNDPTIHATIQLQKGDVWLVQLIAGKKKYLDLNNRKVLEELLKKFQ